MRQSKECRDDMMAGIKILEGSRIYPALPPPYAEFCRQQPKSDRPLLLHQVNNMSTKLRTCAGCNEALGRSEFSKNQWMKGSGTSRCKGCVSGPAASTTCSTAAEKSAAPEPKTTAATDPPRSTDARKAPKASAKAAFSTSVPEKKSPPPSSSKSGDDGNKKKPKSKTSNENVSKVSDKKAALATITSAVSKDEVAAFSESSSSLAASAANQKPGEASTEDSSKDSKKKIKVKSSDIKTNKKGNPVGKFFGGIVRGFRSWTRPVINPCLKMIGQQVVVTEEGGNEDLKMKEQLEKDAQKYSLKGRNE